MWLQDSAGTACSWQGLCKHGGAAACLLPFHVLCVLWLVCLLLHSLPIALAAPTLSAYAWLPSVLTTWSHHLSFQQHLSFHPQDNLQTELAERDWGVQQVLTSANWGGVVGNFFTGGLNLQVRSRGLMH